MKVLYLTNAVPYDKIRHAGGKTFNFYVKRVIQTQDVEIKVVGLCKKEELQSFDFVKYGFDCHPICTVGGFIKNLQRVLVDLLGICTFRNRCNQSYYKTYMLLKSASQIKRSGFFPDVVVLEWTNIVLMAKDVQKLFPKAKLVASEHDVNFQGAERKYLQSTGFKRKGLKAYYLKLKNAELAALDCCKVVMPQSEKDKKLLIRHGISPDCIHVLTPYYHDMSHIKRGEINHDILFWGAMYREENYKAALWFIDNVMPLLTDTDVRFIVAGNKPPIELINKKSKKVIVTGFVEDETPYFAHSLCFVSPLLTGAGIKVKVIEALSSGIPILTNNIGIEGIPAEDSISYFHCTTPDDYALIIRKLLRGEIDVEKLLEKQRKVIEEHFQLEQSAKDYIDMLKRLDDQSRWEVQ